MADKPAEPEKRRRTAVDDLPPADYYDPVIEAYKKDVDRTILRENLKLTVEERFRKYESFQEYARALREAGERARTRK